MEGPMTLKVFASTSEGQEVQTLAQFLYHGDVAAMVALAAT